MGYIMGIPSVTLAEHVLRNNWLASNTLSSAVAASMTKRGTLSQKSWKYIQNYVVGVWARADD